MPFQFQINTPNTALQTIQTVDALEGRREAREMQRESLAVQKQQALAKMDANRLARAKQGVDMMARVAGAALQVQDPAQREAMYRQGIKGLVDQGFTEFAGELNAPVDEGRLQFNVFQAADTGKMIEMSPAWRAAKVQDEAAKYNATIPGRLQVAAAGRSVNNINVAAPNIPQQPVPKIDPATGRIIGFEAPPAPQQAGGRGQGGAAPSPSGLGTPAINMLEESLVNNSAQLARIDRIDREFNPRWLQVRTRVEQSATSAKEKLGMDVKPEDREDLANYTRFRRATLENLNQTIKEITGAAMTIPEAERIQRTMPNSGVGWFDGDSPTEFKAKVDAVATSARSAIARANWARARGLDPLQTGVELQDVPGLINDRAAQVEAEIRAANPSLPDDTVKIQTRQRVGREFGLSR